MLGLANYAGIFEDSDIDLATLPFITEAMLERIGLPMGPRARLLAAMPALRAAPRHSPLPAGTDTSAAPNRLPRSPEIRQLTVLFCDVVDSTSLAGDLDPEEWNALMTGYRRLCREHIERQQGYVAQYLGDGVVAYFGWPATQEHAAEAAVRAALELVGHLREQPGPVKIAVRIGITTGKCLIADAGMGDASVAAGAVGQTPNIAARLQSLAEPNGVLLSGETLRLLPGRVVCRALGAQQLRGVREPVQVFRALRLRDDVRRFPVRMGPSPHRPGAQPKSQDPVFVGRREELALLERRLAEAADGEGRVVFVSGVAGIGKSRIVHELERTLKPASAAVLHFQCLPHASRSPLFPVIKQICRLSGIGPRDAPERKRALLERFIAQAEADIGRTLPHLSALLSIPAAAGDAPPAQTAQQIRMQTLSILADILRGLADRRPVLCVLEDAHWIDPSTQELLDLLISRIDTARILLVVTHRPEYPARADGSGVVSTLSIPRLRRADAEILARSVSTLPRQLTDSAVERIVQLSDAIPLFVEELARGFIDAGSLEGTATGVAVPDSLRDALVARLDRAPEGKSVAQIGAVLGREFSLDTLQQISGLSAHVVDTAVEQLQEADIIQKVEALPSARFAFKHALLRDAAYELMPRSQRRQLHGQIVALFEAAGSEVADSELDLVAQHCSAAGDNARAARYWLRGAERARHRFAIVEAEAQLRLALNGLGLLPPSAERDTLELRVQLALGKCCISLHGYSSDRTRDAFERARELLAQGGDDAVETEVVFGLWGHFWMTARHDRALALAEWLLAHADRAGGGLGEAVAHRTLGSTLFTLGDFPRARQHLETAVQWEFSSPPGAAFAVDPTIAARLMLAWTLWIAGLPGRALDEVHRALRAARATEDPYTLAFAHYVVSAVHLLREEFPAALEHADTSLAISTEYHISLYALYSRFGRGCALCRLGRRDEGLAEIAAGIADAERSQLGYLRGFMLGWLASERLEAGDAPGARAAMDQAFGHIGDVAGRAWEAELWRLDGELRLAAGDGSGAEASFRRALDVAEHQKAGSLQLRAAVSLAGHLLRSGQRDGARTLLEARLAAWEEAPDCADGRRAIALLGDCRTP